MTDQGTLLASGYASGRVEQWLERVNTTEIVTPPETSVMFIKVLMPLTASMSKSDTIISVSKETRELIQSLKRGGEHYDYLLRKMADQYEREPGR